MIRAVIKNGMIHALEPLPATWSEGRAVVVEDVDEMADTLEQWTSDMNALTAELDDPAEWQQIESALADADRQAKTHVRREMGLD